MHPYVTLDLFTILLSMLALSTWSRVSELYKVQLAFIMSSGVSQNNSIIYKKNCQATKSKTKISINQGWNESLIYRAGYEIYRNFRTRQGRVSYARDTQVLTCYCDLLYKPRLDFKPKNPLSIYQARSFSCLSEILGVSCFHTCKDSQIYKSLARACYSNCVGIHWLSV